MRTWWRKYWQDDYALPFTLFFLPLMFVILGVVVGTEVAAMGVAVGLTGFFSPAPGWVNWIFLVFWTGVTSYLVGGFIYVMRGKYE